MLTIFRSCPTHIPSYTHNQQLTHHQQFLCFLDDPVAYGRWVSTAWLEAVKEAVRRARTDEGKEMLDKLRRYGFWYVHL